jgi:multidrug resistance efflux pump
LELARVRAEQKSLRLEVDQAIARGDRPAATFANASLKTMAVREELIGWKIKQAEIRAQADGLIVKGDLEERIGQVVSMGEPLLQIATGESYVELRIPERAAAMVHNGASGHFACAAKPNVRVNCRIERVLPASEIIDQKNVFVAETEVDEPPKWLRIGMEGVAKIDAGWQPVWWIAFHPIIDKIQLWIG